MLVHESDYLAHHGVKGMKWGIRKARERSSQRREARAEKKGYSEEHKAMKELRKKKVSQMTDAELKQVINRMNLEQQYKGLKSRNVSAGQKFVQEVLRETGKEYTKKAINYGINVGTDIAKSRISATGGPIADAVLKDLTMNSQKYGYGIGNRPVQNPYLNQNQNQKKKKKK